MTTEPQWTAEHRVDLTLARRLIEGQFTELLPLKLEVNGSSLDFEVYFPLP
jgi:hypothetical protein